jgi:hypothetical protein
MTEELVTQTVQTLEEMGESLPDTNAPIRIGPFEFSSIGMTVNAEETPGIDKWAEAGHVLMVMLEGVQLCVGDWLRYGESHYGEMAAQVIDSKGWSHSTVNAYRWLSEKVAPSVRRPGLTVSHYMAVATLEQSEQARLLERAAPSEGQPRMTVKELRGHIDLHLGTPEQPTVWQVVVMCDTEKEQTDLITALDKEGWKCVRR